MPKENGVVTPTHAEPPTASKCASPRATGDDRPTTRPTSTATVAMKPRKIRWIMHDERRVPRA